MIDPGSGSDPKINSTLSFVFLRDWIHRLGPSNHRTIKSNLLQSQSEETWTSKKLYLQLNRSFQPSSFLLFFVKMKIKDIESNVPQVRLDEVIGSRSYTIEEIMVTVVVAQIDPKQASDILQEFAALLPLQEYNLDHMKRVRRTFLDRSILEILICPERCINDVPSFLKEKCLMDTIRTTMVPRLKPMTRTEYEEWGRDWPTMFRPNAVDKDREKGFSKSEMVQHSFFMSLVDNDAQNILKQKAEIVGTPGMDSCSSSCNLDGGGIIVNPQNGMVSKLSIYASIHIRIKKPSLFLSAYRNIHQ